jgi:hypothetical protein
MDKSGSKELSDRPPETALLQERPDEATTREEQQIRVRRWLVGPEPQAHLVEVEALGRVHSPFDAHAPVVHFFCRARGAACTTGPVRVWREKGHILAQSRWWVFEGNKGDVFPPKTPSPKSEGTEAQSATRLSTRSDDQLLL